MMKMIFALLAMAAVACTAVAAPQQAAAPASHAQYDNKGTVLEVINTSMYTYLQVEAGSGPVWIAVPTIEVAKGDTVSYPAGMVMSNFHSKSLNRTFPSIIFADQVTKLAK